MTPPPPISERLPDDLGSDPLASYNPHRSQIISSSQGLSAEIGETVRQPTLAEDPALRETLSSTAILKPGQEPFELRRIVGRGGFGEVWEALQTSLGRTVAVKRSRRDPAENEPPPAISTPRRDRAFRQ